MEVLAEIKVRPFNKPLNPFWKSVFILTGIGILWYLIKWIFSKLGCYAEAHLKLHNKHLQIHTKYYFLKQLIEEKKCILYIEQLQSIKQNIRKEEILLYLGLIFIILGVLAGVPSIVLGIIWSYTFGIILGIAILILGLALNVLFMFLLKYFKAQFVITINEQFSFVSIDKETGEKFLGKLEELRE
ncbi:MAG: hypothetical protein KAR17_05085 [Cyclobacteriaceae bacterium]|nr:hypothetical protein [Cyclobacteriaceae bacterium]